MQIASTRKSFTTQAPVSAVSTPEPRPTQEPVDGWVGAALSVAGGVATLAGALTNQPILSVGGSLATAAGTGMTALRVQESGMDSAAWVSFGVGGGLTALGALTMLQPQPQSVPNGPLPTFLRQIGVQTL